MSLAVGTRLGSYEVTAAIGAGGMGEVYRATDANLGREVALKVLPEAFASDPERLARFEREAKLLASLNHSNIAHVYGFESAMLPDGSGAHFLAMELVPGEDLAERLKRGAIPVDEVLAIVRQIAEALEEAHEKGIVHRDLKPANVKLTPDGKVKVLDFGLAKAYAGDTASGSSADLSHSPTLAHTGTDAGLILGTAAYMSPEQARGKAVDKRADIWAFGVVLFEMLTGRQLFHGDTVSDVLASVLKEDPPWDRLPEETPPRLRRLLERCLRKDPRQRLHDVADARLEIEEIGTTPETPSAKPRTRSRLHLAAAIGLVVLGAAAGLVVPRPSKPPAGAPGALRYVVTPGAPAGQAAFVRSVLTSRDGRRVVYWSGSHNALFVKDAGSFSSRLIPGTQSANQPFLSPDGAWVGFYSGGKIRKVALAGGDPITICENPTDSPGASWGPDGTIVFSATWTAGLSRVNASGGQPQALTEPDREAGETAHFWPHFLPDGRAVLFTIFGGSGMPDARVGLLDLDTGRRAVLFPGAAPRYAASGHVVFYRSGAWYAIPFDPAGRQATGPARRVLPDARPLDPLGARESNVSFSDTGTIAYVPGEAPLNSPRSRLAWIDREGRVEGLPFEGLHGDSLSLSLDGARAAVQLFAEGEVQVWIYDLIRGTAERVTRDGQNFGASWHPDGKSLAFTSLVSGSFDVRWGRADALQPEPLVATTVDESEWAWAPDGRSGVFSVYSSATGIDLWSMTVGDPASKRPLVATPLEEAAPRISPDGRWLAFGSGRVLFAARYPQMTDRVLLSQSAERSRWSPSTPELFYLEEGRLKAVRYDAATGVFGAATTLLDVPRLTGTADFAVSPDARRFLFRVPVEGLRGSDEIHIALDGFDLLRAPEGGR